MRLRFTEPACEDYRYWERHEPKKAQKIQKLCEAVLENPYEGIGKPEPLKFDLQGCWSRRIDRVHRLVYQVQEDEVIIIACRYHY